MWQPLWREGLATYVSKVMNPDATESEMLLDFPAIDAVHKLQHPPAAAR